MSLLTKISLNLQVVIRLILVPFFQQKTCFAGQQHFLVVPAGDWGSNVVRRRPYKKSEEGVVSATLSAARRLIVALLSVLSKGPFVLYSFDLLT